MEAFKKISIKDIKLILIGDGILKKDIGSECISENVFFMGYKNNVADYLQISDLYVSTSMQEGLPVNILEALAVGLPVIASNCRGNRDLVKEESLFEIGDVKKTKQVNYLSFSKQ